MQSSFAPNVPASRQEEAGDSSHCGLKREQVPRGRQVLIVTPRFRPLLGGMERECELLAQEYARRGYRPVVITERLGTSEPLRDDRSEIKIRRVPSSTSRGLLNQLRSAIGMALSVLANRQEVEFCIVRTFTLPAVVIGLLKRLRLLDFPTMVTAETGGPEDDIIALSRRRFSGFLRFCVNGNDVFNGICRDNLHHLAALGYPPDRTSFIRNGVSFENYAFITAPAAAKRFLFVGRIEAAKGVDDLVEAFSLIDNSDVSLTIVGTGSGDAALRKTASESPSAERITFRGRVPYDQVGLVLAEHDCVVLPSYSEGLPLTILEAISQKRMIIATDIGDLSELLDGRALLVKPGDIVGLSGAMRRAVAEPWAVDYDALVRELDIRNTADLIVKALC